MTIELPEGNMTTAYVSGGEFGLIFAADTPALSRHGHRGQVVGNTEAIVLQIPTADGKIPDHAVLHVGPCCSEEVVGLRGHTR